jgi:hypothetical protein
MSRPKGSKVKVKISILQNTKFLLIQMSIHQNQRKEEEDQEKVKMQHKIDN